MIEMLPMVSALAHGTAVAALGLFAGAMLTEAGVLVPYWRSLDAETFHGWYRANAERLLHFFGAVTWLAGLSVLVSAVLAFVTGHPHAALFALSAALMVSAVLMFPLYFKGANARFVAGLHSRQETADALRRWALWHWVRTGISAVAFAAAIRALEL